MARCRVLISLLLASLISVAAQSISSAQDSADPSATLFTAPPSSTTTYSVVITLHDDAPADVVGDRIAQLMDTSNADNNYKADFDGTVVNGMAGDFSSNIIHTIQDEFSDLIKAVEPDYTMKISDNSAPLKKQQPIGNWGQARIVQRKFNATQPFIYPDSAGSGIDVFHIDTGIWPDHPDFDHTRVTLEKILVPQEPPVDFNGHGTHTAGIICSQTYGIAKKVRLRSIKALNRFGAGQMSDILLALEYATRQHLAKTTGRSIISMSINGPASVAINTAVNAAYAAGMLVVTAAGNDGVDACQFSPASAPGAYTVGATDQVDAKTPWSNYGPCTNIYAPGLDIRSLWIPIAPLGSNPPDSWFNSPAVYLSGTSMAAPYVSGVAALLMGTLSFDDVRYVRSQLNLMSQRGVIKGMPPRTQNYNRLLNMRVLLTSYWNRKAKWAVLTRKLPTKVKTYEELMAVVSKLPAFKPAAAPPALATTSSGSVATVSSWEDEDDLTDAAAENAAFDQADSAVGSAVDDGSSDSSVTLDSNSAPDWSDLDQDDDFDDSDGIVSSTSSGAAVTVTSEGSATVRR